MREAPLERGHGGLGDVVRGREVGLADLQVHDVLALGLQLPSPGQHLEGPLGAEPAHAIGEADRGCHAGNPIRPRRDLPPR